VSFQRFSWAWFVLPFALGAIVPLACDDGRVELVFPPGTSPDGGDSLDSAFGDGDPNNDGGGDGAIDASAFPVVVSVSPNPRGDGVASSIEMSDARLMTVAAGVRGVVLRRTPAELTSEAALVALETEASAYGKTSIGVNFVFSVVDGHARGIDSAFAGLPWDDPAVLKAMFGRVDQVMTRIGSTVAYFLVGRDVDVFLAAHPGERAAFEAFAGQILEYVRTHPSAAPNLRVGVGFSFAGVTQPDPSWPKCLEMSDVAACSYLPGLGENAAGLAGNIATDADLLVVNALGKPIVVEALGYPTSEAVGASEAKQALFLETFFAALGPRRTNFVFVNVEGLHDLAPGRCADRAAFEGQSVDGVWAAYACSLGLFTADGQPKPSWQVLLDGAAAFASP
jgi:hypothetical protein